MTYSNKKTFLVSSCSILLLISGCAKKESTAEAATSAVSYQMEEWNNQKDITYIDDNYRTTYEICPYSFYDTNEDGIGDLKGIEEKLDYIHDEMGFDEIWLTPVNMAVSYHKYDITDYYSIDPDFGTMEDFESLLDTCHKKNTNLILDLVINHTSIEHPWFQATKEYLRDLGENEVDSTICKYVNYYNFTKEKKSGYELLEGTDWYYEARFWSGMPDLNLDNKEVRDEITQIVQFWLEKGVDGFRLDATTSYYTDSQADTIAFMTWFNTMVKDIKADTYLVGEAWTDTNVIAEYYTSGIDSFFNFPFAGSDGVIAKVVKGSVEASTYSISLENIEHIYSEKNVNFIDAPFYTNHDMNRSAGYYSGDYSEQQTKLAGALNLLMSGNAFVYYGEEIGMKGSGEDPNKRLPMRWSENGVGLCKAPEGSSSVKIKYGTYEQQVEEQSSILNYYKASIRLRNTYPVIARGTTTNVDGLSNEFIAAMEKTKEGYDSLLIIINTSEKTQRVDVSNLNYKTLSAVLNASADYVNLENGELTIPAYDIAILTK